MFFLNRFKFFLVFAFLCIGTESLGAMKCIKGSLPSDKEIQAAKIFNQENENELKKLSILQYEHPKNLKYQEQFQKKHNEMSKRVEAHLRLLKAQQLPKNLELCQEYKLSAEELGKWQEALHQLATRYPRDQDYAFNFKLMHQLMIEKVFAK